MSPSPDQAVLTEPPIGSRPGRFARIRRCTRGVPSARVFAPGSLDAARARLLAVLLAGTRRLPRVLLARPHALTASERRARAATDAFLTGVLIHRVRAHYEGVTFATGLAAAEAPELAARAKVHVELLAAEASEVGSCVMEIQDALTRRGCNPPPFPRSPRHGVAWAGACEALLPVAFQPGSWPTSTEAVPAVSAAIRDDERAGRSLELGVCVGAVFEHVYGLAIADDLHAHAPAGHPDLAQQRASRRASLVSALDRFETLLRDPTLAIVLGTAWIERARHAWFVAGRDTSEVAPPRPWRPAGEAWQPNAWTARFVVGELVPTLERLLAPDQLAPREAIAAYRDRTLDLAGLLRAIVEHGAWKVPAVLEPGAEPRALIVAGGYPRVISVDNLSCVQAFSDDRAAAVNPDPTGLAPYLVGAGHRVFASVTATIDALDLDPNVEGGMRWNRSALADLAAAVRVGAVAATVQHWAWVDRGHLAGFDGWWALMQAGEPCALTLRDAAGRSFAPVFTSEAAVQAFVDAHAIRSEDARWTTIAGVALFSALAERDIDGVWFDPAGPGRGRRFDRAFARLLATTPA
jgi:hypothetical protein